MLFQTRAAKTKWQGVQICTNKKLTFAKLVLRKKKTLIFVQGACLFVFPLQRREKESTHGSTFIPHDDNLTNWLYIPGVALGMGATRSLQKFVLHSQPVEQKQTCEKKKKRLIHNWSSTQIQQISCANPNK